MEKSESFASPEKMRDSGLGSDSFTGSLDMSGGDGHMFRIDDVPRINAEGSGRDSAISQTSESSALPASALPGRTYSEVFRAEDHGILSRSFEFPERRPGKARKPFRSLIEAVDAFVPVGKQRHTNFTPPRLSPLTLSDHEEDPIGFECPVHKRRSSACLVLCKQDLEREIAENLRSVSDHFHVKCAGLGGGYHLQNHPHSVYHRAYPSSFPGTPSAPDVRRDSINGMKVRKAPVCVPMPHQ